MVRRRSSFAVDCGVSGEGKRSYFSTLSRKFITVPETFEKIISGADAGGTVSARLGKSLWVTEAENYSAEMLEALRLIAASGAGSSTLNVMFTMTTRCNLSCGYCFQNNAFRSDASDRVLSSLPGFIARELRTRPAVKYVRLILFGGEPLLRQEQCLALLKSAKELCDSLMLGFEGGIVTNGLGAASVFWESAANHGLRSVQITIDGAEKLHDTFRRLDGEGTYRRLLAKFSRLSKGLRVGLKYNLTRESSECFAEFISDIGTSGFDRKNTQVVLEAVKTIDYNEPREEHFKSASLAAADAYIACAGIATAAGWRVCLSHVFQPPCMYTQEKPSTILIRPDGTVSRCISVYNDDPDFFGGDITGAGLAGAGRNIHKEIAGNAGGCVKAECPYFPICLTGCPSFKKMHLKTVNAAHCRRGYLERIVTGLARLKADQGENYKLLEF